VPPGGKAELAAFAERFGRPGMFGVAFEVAEFEAEAPFPAAGFQLQAIQVEHYGRDAYGFRVADGDGSLLGYSGDTGPCESLRRIAAGADLFLCEATLATGADDGGGGVRGHLSADEALAHADGASVLLTHRPFELATPDGVARASDGLAVEI
jgi:ribonuclease BN (tRNA processing enzyme)